MSQRSELLHWIQRLDQARILVMGDIMLDQFIYGDVTRISPEGPVPVLQSIEKRSLLGGAGNVVRNLAALGARTTLLSLVGMDKEADQIRQLLSELATVESSLITDGHRHSTVKTRYLSKQQQLLRVDVETPSPMDLSGARETVEHLSRSINGFDILIISDYGKGFLTPDLLKRAIGLCRQHGKPILVDPKGLDYSIYQNASLLTPNLKELGEATRMPVPDDAGVVAAARVLIERCGVQAVLATRSQEGMTLVESSGQVAHFRSEAKEVFDVTGAGDTVIATLSAALATGCPLRDSVEIANIAAGIVVGKTGTAVPHVRDMVHAIRQQELSTAESKVLDLESAADRVDVWRRKGYKIGFLNGFFELLYPAHIELISHASKSCDRLIVGVHSDSSIYRIKGKAPILQEAARSAIIGSLEDVDMVVLFSEETPARVLELLKPDVRIQREKEDELREDDFAVSAAVPDNGINATGVMV